MRRSGVPREVKWVDGTLFGAALCGIGLTMTVALASYYQLAGLVLIGGGGLLVALALVRKPAETAKAAATPTARTLKRGSGFVLLLAGAGLWLLGWPGVTALLYGNPAHDLGGLLDAIAMLVAFLLGAAALIIGLCVLLAGLGLYAAAWDSPRHRRLLAIAIATLCLIYEAAWLLYGLIRHAGL